MRRSVKATRDTISSGISEIKNFISFILDSTRRSRYGNRGDRSQGEAGMHTTGLVVTLSGDRDRAAAALAELTAAGPFTVGHSVGPCWAVVLETPGPESTQTWHDWALGVPGVESVEVVFVHWDEAAEPELTHGPS
jgi:hypothetical protein